MSILPPTVIGDILQRSHSHTISLCENVPHLSSTFNINGHLNKRRPSIVLGQLESSCNSWSFECDKFLPEHHHALRDAKIEHLIFAWSFDDWNFDKFGVFQGVLDAIQDTLQCVTVTGNLYPVLFGSPRVNSLLLEALQKCQGGDVVVQLGNNLTDNYELGPLTSHLQTLQPWIIIPTELDMEHFNFIIEFSPDIDDMDWSACGYYSYLQVTKYKKVSYVLNTVRYRGLMEL